MFNHTPRYRTPEQRKTIRLLGCGMAVYLGINLLTTENTHGGPNHIPIGWGISWIAFGVIFAIITLWIFRKKSN